MKRNSKRFFFADSIAALRSKKIHYIASDFLPEHSIFFVVDLKRTNIALCEAPPITMIFSTISFLEKIY